MTFELNKRRPVVFFLINDGDASDFRSLAEEYLSDVDIHIDSTVPSNLEDYALIVLWSIRRLLPEVAGRSNVIVFHSSDLPHGKGWAPIYNAITRGENFFTITGIMPEAKVDAGNIVVRAQFAMRPEYTAEFLRAIDHRICMMLIAAILKNFPDGHLRGIPQSGESTFYLKRTPEENEISLDASLVTVIDHLRACEPSHPAFFLYKGIRYNIAVSPAAVPEFPKEVLIEFPALS